MDGEAFVEHLESAKRSELDRLGSSGLLIALTDATLEEAAVLSAAAASEHTAAGTFRAWTEDETDAAAREAFAEVAAQEETHRERVVARMDGFDPPAEPGPMHAYLRGRTDTVERLATGLVARPLVSVRTHTQVISFFVNQADEGAADLFRELKAETAALIDEGAELLDARCADGDWERAQVTAEYCIQVAYDDFADALGALGLSPKSIC